MKKNNFKKLITSEMFGIWLLIVTLLLLIFSDSHDATVNEPETTSEETTIAEEMYTEETTSKNVTVEELTIEQATEDTTVEETTVEETTVEETTTEEKTTEEATTVEERTVEKTTVEETTAEETTTAEIAPEEVAKKKLDVNCILQLPDLPTGCEITSLAIVLNYKGIVADKCDLADNYLEKGKVGTVLPTNAFLGNPRDNNSYGCYSPVIVKTANKYLSAKGSSLKATDLSGSTFESLLTEIDAGNPIVIWATLNMAEPYYSVTWNIGGEKFTWKSKEHCLVLTGYDMEAGIVYVADPMKGNVTYNMKTFKDRYEKMYSQAVVIK